MRHIRHAVINLLRRACIGTQVASASHLNCPAIPRHDSMSSSCQAPPILQHHKRILTDFYENVPPLYMSTPKCARLFWYLEYFLSEVFDFSCDEDRQIRFVWFKTDFLSNQWEYEKSLTRFWSPSSADWQCPVCLVVLVNTGYSEQQTLSVMHLKACILLPIDQIFKIILSPHSKFYKLYGNIYFSMVSLLAW